MTFTFERISSFTREAQSPCGVAVNDVYFLCKLLHVVVLADIVY